MKNAEGSMGHASPFIIKLVQEVNYAICTCPLRCRSCSMTLPRWNAWPIDRISFARGSSWSGDGKKRSLAWHFQSGTDSNRNLLLVMIDCDVCELMPIILDFLLFIFRASGIATCDLWFHVSPVLSRHIPNEWCSYEIAPWAATVSSFK